MEYKCFEVSKSEGVAQINMCRPEKANAMNADFWGELPDILDMLDQAGDVRVCILSASGKHFSAGMDLSFFAAPEFATLETARQREVLIDMVGKLQGVFHRLEQVRFPVIAAVQGACVGGALDMIAACDLRYATQEAQFSIEEINIGLMADLGSLQRLPMFMPEGVVREMAYTGQKLDAQRALKYGLVNQIFDSSNHMMEAVSKIAKQIAAKNPLALSATKKAFNFSRNHGVTDALDYAGILQAAILDPADIGRAVKSKINKTKPTYQDLAPQFMSRGKNTSE